MASNPSMARGMGCCGKIAPAGSVGPGSRCTGMDEEMSRSAEARDESGAGSYVPWAL